MRIRDEYFWNSHTLRILTQSFKAFLCLTPEILFLPDEHETDVDPYCGEEEAVDEQVGDERQKSPPVVGNLLFDDAIGIDHDEEAERYQSKSYEKPGEGQGQ